MKRLVLVVLSLSLLTACPKPVTNVAVSPKSAGALTCSTVKLSAKVTGGSTGKVSWSVDPAGTGSIDASGLYTTPTAMPDPATVTVTATSQEDTKISGSSTLTLADAIPSTPAAIPGSAPSNRYGVYQHWVAGDGSREYAIWPLQVAGSAEARLMVAKSDDGGATWTSVAPAVDTQMDHVDDSVSYIDCAAVAVDAGNPDVVYALAEFWFGNDLSKGVGANDTNLVFSVSTDGGKTFTPSVLQIGGSSGGPNGWDSVGICPDIVSSAANTVEVLSPGGYGCDGNPDLILWSDANEGSGFDQGVLKSNDYVANGYTTALENLNGATSCSGHIFPSYNGGSDASGGTVESPRAFTDGNGRLCITYVGSLDNGNGTTAINTYVQCSSDAGQTFTAPTVLDPQSLPDVEHNQANGAFGPGGDVAVVWTQADTSSDNLYVATSSDGGATFGAPVNLATYVIPSTSGSVMALAPSVGYDASGVLWIAYDGGDGGFYDRVIVDKSCDNGKTWNGPVLVNGPEGSIADMRWPALVPSRGAAPTLMTTAKSGELDYLTLGPPSASAPAGP